MSPSLAVAAPLRVEATALRSALGRRAVHRTGMGPDRSRRAASGLRRSGASALAVAGLCGSLDPELRPGEVLVASEVLGGDVPIPCDAAPALLDALRRRGISARSGVLYSVDRIVRGDGRVRLRERGAIAADMESAWLAPAAEGIPFAVLRVVIDAPGYELLRIGRIRDALRGLKLLRQSAPALKEWQSTVASLHPRSRVRAQEDRR